MKEYKVTCYIFMKLSIGDLNDFSKKRDATDLSVARDNVGDKNCW